MLSQERDEELLVASKQGNLLQDSWESLLGFRISLQRVIEEANKLPSIPISSSNSKFKEKDREALTEVQNTLKETFCSLYEVLQTKKDDEEDYQLDDSDDESDGKTIEELWEKTLQKQQSRQPYWEEVLDVWNSRVHFGSEKAKSKLKLFNQSLWSQIETVMANDRRVLEKSRPQVDESKRIGLKEELTLVKELQTQNPRKRVNSSIWVDYDEDDDMEMLEDEDEEIIKQKNANKKRKMLDLEVYDDRQFYSLLLKSFITSKASRTSEGLLSANEAKHLSALRALRKKKDVDRKASKGRKIRYNVHDKLKNFMFPIPHHRTTEIDPQRLFESLFQ